MSTSMNEILEKAFERFAIMTVDGGLSDKEAYEYLEKHYSQDVSFKVWKIVNKGIKEI